jgi:hypothetical protein
VWVARQQRQHAATHTCAQCTRTLQQQPRQHGPGSGACARRSLQEPGAPRQTRHTESAREPTANNTPVHQPLLKLLCAAAIQQRQQLGQQPSRGPLLQCDSPQRLHGFHSQMRGSKWAAVCPATASGARCCAPVTAVAAHSCCACARWLCKLLLLLALRGPPPTQQLQQHAPLCQQVADRHHGCGAAPCCCSCWC